MKSVFFTRYELDSNGNLIDVAYNRHLPFSFYGLEDYPCRLWYSLMILKEKLTVLMNKKRQQQVCRNSVSIFFSSKAWEYLCRQFSSVSAPRDFSKVRSKPYQFSDLSLETRTTIAHFRMIQIADHASMERAKEVFGNTFGIGSRNLPPLKDELCRKVIHGDIINVVNVSSVENTKLLGASRKSHKRA
jgi:hypothetical protein